MKTIALILAFVFSWPFASHGGLTQHDLAGVGAAAPPNATASPALRFVDDDGAPLTLGQAMGGRPTVLVFADYTCTYLCGPGLVLTAAALDHTRLAPDRDYSFVVVGINPADGPAAARAMRQRRLRPGAGAAAHLLSDGPAAQLAAALGYRYVFDAANNQFAHDTVIYVLTPAGRVAQVLPELALTGDEIAGAINRAAHPAPGAPGAQFSPLAVLCYCLQPLTGAFDQPAEAALRVGGVGFLALAGGAFFVVTRRRERRK